MNRPGIAVRVEIGEPQHLHRIRSHFATTEDKAAMHLGLLLAKSDVDLLRDHAHDRLPALELAYRLRTMSTEIDAGIIRRQWSDSEAENGSK